MILLTFLGQPRQPGGYSEATYQFGDRRHMTQFFPAALPRLVDGISEVRVFLTQGARQGWQPLQAELRACGLEPRDIDIPDGRNTEELWTIFERLVADIPQQAELVFDVTHGFRSLPLFSALAVAFLKASRQVELKGVLYGAFDARGDDKMAPVPVFDLSIMVSLLDWISAVDRFRHHLDGQPLKQLLDQIQREAHKQKPADAPLQLITAGNALSKLTDALLLGRVREVLRETPQLSNTLGREELRHEAARWAKPLLLLLDSIKELVDQIGRTSELDLAAHLRLAKLYNDRRLFVVAITVFREWVVSRACRLAGLTEAELVDEKRREQIEKLLGTHLQDKIGQRADTAAAIASDWLHTPEAQEILQLWTHLPHIRNDVDHAGMKKEDKSASTLIKNIRELVLGNPIGDEPNVHPHVTLDVSTLYATAGSAKLAELPAYELAAKDAVRPGADVTLTGAGPVWLYLKVGHALHGRARRLFYDSPVTGSVPVFDHSPE